LPTESGGSRRETFECDTILSAGGFAPAVHLHSQAGGKLQWLEDSAMFVPDGNPAGMVSVGACAGVFNRDSALNHAAEVGRALARGSAVPAAAVAGGAGRALAATTLSGVSGQAIRRCTERCTSADVGLAAQENYRSVEHLKRYTTTGMGTDQGKTSNVNALVLMGEFTGREPAEVGTTKFRPPFAPVTLGLVRRPASGRAVSPAEAFAGGALAQRAGARCSSNSAIGTGRPPTRLAGENLEAAAQREARAVRRSVGVLDGSPLGKLEIFGPDAARFSISCTWAPCPR
jgi:sarcosine oxidase subunit alpha